MKGNPGDLAMELERRYNVIIKFDNESIKNYRFNGIMAEETFEQVLEVIKVSAPINYKITNNVVLWKTPVQKQDMMNI